MKRGKTKGMTMNYCGKCGTANGIKAYFCRQCGAELNNQSKLVFPSAPLDVEAGKSNMLEPQNQPSRSVSDPSAPTLIDHDNLTPSSSQNDENSGPLEMIVPLLPQMPPPPPPAPQVMVAIHPEMPQHAPRRVTTPMVPTGIDPRSGP